jgi:hypothetical protein
MPKLPAFHRCPLASAMVAASMLSLSAGCASVTSTAPANPQVAGRWELDKSASDLVDTKVDAAISAWQARLRKRSSYYDSSNAGTGGGYGGRGGRRGGGPGGGPGGGTQDGSSQGGDVQGGSADQGGENTGEEVDLARPLPPDFAGVRRRLIQVLTPPVMLRIDTGPELVRIAPDGIPPRDYHTDEELSRIDEYGTAEIDAGWSGDVFELQARYSSHARLAEHYAVDAHGNTLTVTCHLNDPMVGKIDVTSVYHRG